MDKLKLEAELNSLRNKVTDLSRQNEKLLADILLNDRRITNLEVKNALLRKDIGMVRNALEQIPSVKGEYITFESRDMYLVSPEAIETCDKAKAAIDAIGS